MVGITMPEHGTHRNVPYEICATYVDGQNALVALVHFLWGTEETEYCDSMIQARWLAFELIEDNC